MRAAASPRRGVLGDVSRAACGPGVSTHPSTPVACFQRCGKRRPAMPAFDANPNAWVLPAPPTPRCCGDAGAQAIREIGRAHVCTPVTNAHLVCRLLLEK